MNLWVLIFFNFVAYASGEITVCYFTNSFKDNIRGITFQLEASTLCTHVVYSYATINGLLLSQGPPERVTEGYASVLRARSVIPNVRILLAVGSSMEKPESFFVAALNAINRKTFASKLTDYLRVNHFDGAVMEWANLAATQNPRYDKAKFLLLLQTIRETFNKYAASPTNRSLILSLTLPAFKKQLDSGYDVVQLVSQADFITIRTYDMRTAKDKKVGLSAPLYSDPKAVGDDRYLSVDWITKYYIALGVPKGKINIGVPTFARTFKLRDAKKNNIGDAAVGPGNPGPWTKTSGVLSYPEVCQLFLVGGSVKNVASQRGRYYTNGSLWASYEDILSVSQKICFIKRHQLNGLTFWTSGFDDFLGTTCRNGKHPLITTAANMITYRWPRLCSDENLTKYWNVPKPAFPYPAPTYEADKPAIVCYYTNWSQFRRGIARFLPEDIDHRLCSHIVYCYAVVKDYKIVPYIPNDISKPWIEGMYDRVTRAKTENPNLKVLLGVGGGYAGYTAYEKILVGTSTIDTFAATADTFLREHNFDGMEVTWQEPSSGKAHMFSYLLQSLKRRFGKTSLMPGLILQVAMPPGKSRIDEGYRRYIKEITESADILNLQTYDFHGSWDARTGYNSPLYVLRNAQGIELLLNVHWVVKYYLSLGVPRNKMTLGIPTYGRSFTLLDESNNFVDAPVSGPGLPGKYTAIAGLFSYYEVCEFFRNCTAYYSSYQQANHAFKGTQWVGFDDYDSVSAKSCYANQYGLAGVNVRTLDYDDFKGAACEDGYYPLLRRIHEELRGRCYFSLMAPSAAKADRSAPGKHLLYLHLLLLWAVVSFDLT